MCEKATVRFEWSCPHCGYRNFGFATVCDRHGSLSPALVYCDLEEGGCDRMVAVKPRLLVQTEVYALVGTETEHYPDLDAALDAEERKAEAE